MRDQDCIGPGEHGMEFEFYFILFFLNFILRQREATEGSLGREAT